MKASSLAFPGRAGPPSLWCDDYLWPFPADVLCLQSEIISCLSRVKCPRFLGNVMDSVCLLCFAEESQ